MKKFIIGKSKDVKFSKTPFFCCDTSSILNNLHTDGVIRYSASSIVSSMSKEETWPGYFETKEQIVELINKHFPDSTYIELETR